MSCLAVNSSTHPPQSARDPLGLPLPPLPPQRRRKSSTCQVRQRVTSVPAMVVGHVQHKCVFLQLVIGSGSLVRRTSQTAPRASLPMPSPCVPRPCGIHKAAETRRPPIQACVDAQYCYLQPLHPLQLLLGSAVF